MTSSLFVPPVQCHWLEGHNSVHCECYGYEIGSLLESGGFKVHRIAVRNRRDLWVRNA